MNLDPRSLVENTEIGLMIDAPDLSRGMAEGFDAEIDVRAFELTLQPNSQGKPALRWQGSVDGEMTTLSSSPYTTAWQRFLAKIMGWLPVESQL